MKTVIRYGAFETNSSSSHSFIIGKNSNKLKTREDYVKEFFTFEDGMVSGECSNAVFVIKERDKKFAFLNCVLDMYVSNDMFDPNNPPVDQLDEKGHYIPYENPDFVRYIKLLNEVGKELGINTEDVIISGPCCNCDACFNNGTLDSCTCLWSDNIKRVLGFDSKSTDSEIKTILKDILSDDKIIVLGEGWYGGDCDCDFDIL